MKRVTTLEKVIIIWEAYNKNNQFATAVKRPVCGAAIIV
jgi:hypothetical protein